MSIRLKNRVRLFAVALLAMSIVFVMDGWRTYAEEKPETLEVVPTTFVGEITGAPESARIAFVVEGNKFVAYVCSGDQTFNDSFSRWLRGEVKDGKLSVTVDEIELVATLKDTTLTGTIKKGKAHEFTAKAIPGDANAGLFRAADKLGDDDVIFGWIMDEKGTVVGTAGKKNGPVQTLPAPKGTNISGAIKGQKVPAGKVNGAANNANASTTRKFDAAARAEFLKGVVADQQAAGGNAVQAMLIQQMRRFDAGKTPETKLEEKVFASLKAAPRGKINEYIKLWDKLPATTRNAFLGQAATKIDANTGLTAAKAKELITAMPNVRGLVNQPAGKAQNGTVKGVNITSVKCVDETNPEAFGQDEVFALHTVVVGGTGPATKQTAVLREFDDGITKLFSATDKVAFPLAGLNATPGAEVLIVTTLFEDDGTVLIEVLNTLKPLIEAAAIIAIEAFAEGKNIPLDDATKEAIKSGITGVVNGGIAALSNLLVQPLGTDAIVVRPNGTVVGTNGAPKTKMTFRRVQNGDLKHEYELSGFEVQK